MCLGKGGGWWNGELVSLWMTGVFIREVTVPLSTPRLRQVTQVLVRVSECVEG